MDPAESSAASAPPAAEQSVEPSPSTAEPAAAVAQTPAAFAVAPEPAAAADAEGGERKDPEYPPFASEYELLSEIGVGAFATVYRARLTSRNEEVAVKILDLEGLNTNWEETRKEIQTMRQMKHPNVVPIHCAFVEEQELWVVMPLLTVGSCSRIIKEKFPQGIKDEAVVATILLEVLKALQYFHNDSMIHRDVKAGNILISGKGEVQLADFGVVGTLMEHGERSRNRQSFVGTPCWMAPEVMAQNGGYDTKADIWSFAITAMELGYGRAPYSTFQPMKVLLMTLQEEPPTCDIYKDDSYKFSKHYHKLIDSCLQKDPAKRPTAKKLMEHKFFKSAKGPELLMEKLVSQLEPVGMSLPGGQPLQRRKKTPAVAVKKPISVESWVFDDEAKKEMRKHRSGMSSSTAEGTEAARGDASQEGPAPESAAASSEQAPLASQKKGRFLVLEDRGNGACKAEWRDANSPTLDQVQEGGVAHIRQQSAGTDSRPQQKGRFQVKESPTEAPKE